MKVLRECSPPNICHISHVLCHVSSVVCLLSKGPTRSSFSFQWQSRSMHHTRRSVLVHVMCDTNLVIFKLLLLSGKYNITLPWDSIWEIRNPDWTHNTDILNYNFSIVLPGDQYLKSWFSVLLRQLGNTGKFYPVD